VLKAVIYARYSSDNQRVASIEDQFRVCREHAGRERWQIVDTYHDAAISGASVILRPGVRTLFVYASRSSGVTASLPFQFWSRGVWT
jgi:site-specific DNA recombinase